MFPEQLKKILTLIKRTGDRLVVVDPNFPSDAFVVMDIENYGRLSGVEATQTSEKPFISSLTEEDLTDKINREISAWKNQEGSAYLADETKARPGWKIPSQVKEQAQKVEE